MGTISISSGPPKFKHDCNKCNFLGIYEREGKLYDLYHCYKNLQTVIARFGDDENYMSGLKFAKGIYKIDPNHPLVAAMMVANSMKLLKIDYKYLRTNGLKNKKI